MASEVPPNPITTNFIPEAWDTARTETEYNKALDANYIKLSPQNAPITFLNSLTIPTPAPESDTTLATTTAWVRTFFTSLLSQTLVWNLLQTYVGFLTNAINPSGASGTLLIGHGATNNNVEIASIPFRYGVLNLGNGANASGGIHIGNGVSSNNDVNILNGTGSGGMISLGTSSRTISLGCPLSPTYSFDLPKNPSVGTNTYGTFGAVGYTIVNAISSFGAYGDTNRTFAHTIMSISLPKGIWYLEASIFVTRIYGFSAGLSFGTTIPTNPITGKPNTMFGCIFPMRLSAVANSSIANSMTTSGIYSNDSTTPITMRTFIYTQEYGIETGEGTMTATRIA
jgi:hypothetical protein